MVLGTSHRIAGVEWRGRLAFSAGEAREWLATFDDPAIRELVVLSTCNRVEFYVATTDVCRAESGLRRAVARSRGGDWLAPGPHRYLFEGERAIRHLCRVSCGLDSMLIGEAEILGQLRSALEIASSAGTAGPVLTRVFQAAVHVGRRARVETRIAVGVTSLPAAAVTAGERALGSLADRVVVIAGAGRAARLAAERVAKRRPARIVIANRSLEAAVALARDVGAVAVPLGDLPTAMVGADLVIAAIDAPGPLITAEAFPSSIERMVPLVLVDLSMPPVLDPRLAQRPGIVLNGLDDLNGLIGEHALRRTGEIPVVEDLAGAEATRIARHLWAPRMSAAGWRAVAGAAAAC